MTHRTIPCCQPEINPIFLLAEAVKARERGQWEFGGRAMLRAVLCCTAVRPSESAIRTIARASAQKHTHFTHRLPMVVQIAYTQEHTHVRASPALAGAQRTIPRCPLVPRTFPLSLLVDDLHSLKGWLRLENRLRSGFNRRIYRSTCNAFRK